MKNINLISKGKLRIKLVGGSILEGYCNGRIYSNGAIYLGGKPYYVSNIINWKQL